MSGAAIRSRLLALLAFWLLAFGAAAAPAAVQITFYSKELGASFPHAFVTMAGTLDRSGQRIDVNYGFTAKAVTPAILWGRVKGEVVSDHGAAYIRASDKHFTLTLSDTEYDKVIATVKRWRALPQPSYDLDRRNCIHFVAEIAVALGMRSTPVKGLMKKPRSFLDGVAEANRSWLTARRAIIHRAARG